MKVKALQKHYYDRCEYQPGEEFNIDDREAMNVDILCKLGKLELVKQEAKVAEQQIKSAASTDYETTSVEPEQEEHHENGEPKKRYRRRDMRAES